MSDAPHGQPNNLPESLTKLQDEVSANLAAIIKANNAGDTQLASELKAKHKELFGNAAAEARQLGFVSDTQAEKPDPIELPHDLKEINEDLQQITTDYNNAVHENNTSLAQDLRGKLDKTKATFEEAAKKHSILLGASNVWVEIHNNGWDWLKSRGHWDVIAGDWVSPAVDGWIKPGDTCFLQMTGNWVHGVNAYTYWEWNDGSHPAVRTWWEVYQGSKRASGYNEGGGWYHTWSGKSGDIVKFYFSH